MQHKHALASSFYVTLTLLACGVFAQPIRTSTEPGVWSKNMELIRPLNWRGKEPVRMQKIGVINSLVSTVSTRYVPNRDTADPNRWVSHLLVTNVEDPRNAFEAVQIRSRDTAVGGALHFGSTIDFGYVATWTDTLGSAGIHGHTFAVAYVESALVYHDGDHPTNDIHARFLIFDLTRALADADSEGTTDIVLGDPKERTVTIGGHAYHDVYIGYVPLEGKMAVKDSIGISSMSVEPRRGLLFVSPRELCYHAANDSANSYVEIYDLRTIASDAHATSTTNFVTPSAILESDNNPLDLLKYVAHADTRNFEQVVARDIVPEYINDNTVRLYIAAAAESDSNHEDFRGGGCVSMAVHFNGAAVIDTVRLFANAWRFSDDRAHPSSKNSPDSSWRFPYPDSHNFRSLWEVSNVQSFMPLTTGSSHYFATATEFFDKVNADYLSAIGFQNPLVKAVDTMNGSWVLQGTTNYDPSRDERRSGNYLRIWNASDTSVGGVSASVAEGHGSGLGPLTSYEAREQTGTGSHYTAAALKNGDIAELADTALFYPLVHENQPGPASIHRIGFFDPTSSELFLAYNAQGVRVVDCSKLPEQGGASSTATSERAYFDFVPTRYYDAYYFDIGNVASTNFFAFVPIDTQLAAPLHYPALEANWKYGIWDVKGDLSHRTYDDENFIYASGIGDKGSPITENQQYFTHDNWLMNGGILILRYFDKEIGGTITGYAGTGTGENRPYRLVNLQGAFTASRTQDDDHPYAVTVDTGTTVNLLAGDTASPTALLHPSGSRRKLLVNGTLNVFLRNGELAYTDSTNSGGDVIALDVTVSSTGTLNVKSGADARFAGNVLVQEGGHWNVETGATLRLGHFAYVNNGHLQVVGDTTVRVNVRSYEGVPTIVSGSPVVSGAFGISGSSVNSAVVVNHAYVDNVTFLLNHGEAGSEFKNSIFRITGHSGAGDSACIAIYDMIASATVEHNSFSTRHHADSTLPSFCDIAVAIRDNLSCVQSVGESNVIHGFRTGIVIDQSTAHVRKNTIDSCWFGMKCRTVAALTRIDSNEIRYSQSSGIVCNSSNPYILANYIHHGSEEGVFAGNSSPYLGCNDISRNQTGVLSGFPSYAGMGIDLLSATPARNFVKENYKTQLHIDGGQTVDILNGENSFSVDQLGVFVCAGGSFDSTLAVGTGNMPNPAQYPASHNYWGTYNHLPPAVPKNVDDRMCDSGLFNLGTLLVGEPFPCDVGDASVFGATNCSHYTAVFDSNSGHFSGPCDSLVARYNKEINCGDCFSAKNDLEAAIMVCDPGSRDELTALLQRLLRVFNSCQTMRNQAGAPALAAWYANYAVATSHDSNRIPAKWMEAMVYGVGQYYSAAIALYDSIASLHYPAPFDSTSAAAMSEMYKDMMDIEGDNALPPAKLASTQGYGRGGELPEDGNVIDLALFANPISIVKDGTINVTFAVPEKDGDEFVEVKIFTMLGEDVATLVAQDRKSGRYHETMDVSWLKPGSYVVAVHLKSHMQSRMLVVVK